MVTGGPSGVAALLPAPGWVVAAWVVGGIISFAGALVFAELGATLPRAGGQYVFLREAYGDLIGFVYGWTLFAVINTGSLAALAVGYAEYFGFFFPAFGTDRILLTLPFPGAGLPISAGQINAAFVIVLLSFVNYFGVKEGSVFQGIITVVKIASFAGFMALGLLFGAGSLDHFFPLFGPAAGAAAPAGAAGAAGAALPAGAFSFGGFVLAMIAMLWAYEGWNNITFTAGEIKDPQRNIPRSLVFGMCAITAIYVGMNLLYIYAMPVGEMTATARIGEAAAERLFGPTGSWLMSLAVLVSIFGCISATVISGPRVFYAMARDGLFFRSIGTVHPRWRTPATAIFWQCAWSAILCLSGTYNQLITFVVFAAVLFYALAGASVIVLRRRHPEWPRPYRTWGYPLTPLVYVALSVIVLVNTLVSQPRESVWGLGIVVAGLPLYLFWKRRPRGAGGAPAGRAAVIGAVLIAAATAGAAAGAAPPHDERTKGDFPDPGIYGFHEASLPGQRRVEAALLAAPDTARLEQHARALTARPHVAGTSGNAAVQRYIADRFREYGLEVERKSYAVYLGFVKRASLEQVAPERVALATPEEIVRGEKPAADGAPAGEDVRLNWNGYSPSCDLTRAIVFVHHGRPEDFDAVAAKGVDVAGRIVLVRNFKGYRGAKVLEARRRGAAAVVFYNDPADDGHGRGKVWPDGPWGPDSHIQRGATTLDFYVPGDPLTPGWASLPGARRIDPDEARVLPRLPSIPISGRDALVLLRNLEGPRAPREWQGALPVTYRLGPGPSRARLKIEASFETRPITNVIGIVRGARHPEQKVILGNHHDAWVYGAVDPASGTAAMLELARAAGALARGGIRPARTLVFGSWDAEEWSLTGSTEWGEEFAEDLARHGVACLNFDAAVAGPDFEGAAVPTLRRLFSEALRDVTDPRGGRSLLARAEAASAAAEGTSFKELYGAAHAKGGPGRLEYDILGGGSDYTVFLNHLGIPALEGSFEGPYGVYHSAYDTVEWMKRWGDPGFEYHAAAARLWGILAYRVANADLLPFEEGPYPEEVGGYLDDLGRARGADRLDLADLRSAVTEWRAAAGEIDRAVARALASPTPPAAGVRDGVNALLMRAERDLLAADGIPDRPWYRHLLYAPLPSYAPETLPGIREAIVEGDAPRARHQAARLAAALRARSATLRRAAALLDPHDEASAGGRE